MSKSGGVPGIAINSVSLLVVKSGIDDNNPMYKDALGHRRFHLHLLFLSFDLRT